MVLADSFNPVLLDNDENFLAWLNPELVELQETEEQGCLTTLSITYPIEDINEAKEIFKIGNKIWIPQVNGLRPCLYIINEAINEDLFEDNCVTFDVEDVLSELNYAPLFSQTGVTTANLGTTVNNEGTFTICKSALEYFFGDYFTIDIFESCSNSHIQKITPCGTMTKMEFLRYIEDETNNVFRTRYVKSEKDNTIIRYLDFLDPTKSTLCREHEGIIDLGYNAENIQYEIDESDTFRAIAPELSLNEEKGSVSSSNQLSRKELGIVISEFENLSAMTSDQVPMIVQKGSGVYPTHDEGDVANRQYWRRGVTDTTIPRSTLLKYKGSTSSVPSTSGKKIGDFYNVTTKLTYNNTDVEAGSLLVYDGSKWVVVTSSDNKEFYIATAYWNPPFPKHAGEFFVADIEPTGCQYNQIRGKNYADRQLIIENGESVFRTPSEFTENPPDETDIVKLPKIGTVSTSDVDVYAIYNDCCTKLIEKRFPNFNMDIDIKDLDPSVDSAFNLYDTVKVKVPGYSEYITANVQKTVKDPHNIGESNISLSNINIGSKIVQQSTEFTGNNLTMKYGNSGSLTIKLYHEDTPLSKKLVTFAVLKKEDNSENYSYTGTTYNKKTDSNGEISLPIKWGPGYYQVEITFGGDLEYAMCSERYNVTVTGTTSSSSKYYDKYGRSPDNKYICAIGKAVTSSESKKYGTNFYKSIFKRKCPVCGSTNLAWGIFWAGNETSTSGKFLNKTRSGSNKGRIFCISCGSDFSCIDGIHSSSKKLTKVKTSVKSTKSDAYLLKKGKLGYDSKSVNVTATSSNSSNANPLDRAKYSCSNKSGTINKTVASKAKSIIGSKTGVNAVKAIVSWISTNIVYEKRSGFYQSPYTTLKRKKGGGCCQTDLLAHMLDSVGLLQSYTFVYVYCKNTKGTHCFAQVQGKDKVNVDVTKTKNAWGNYIKTYGGPISKSSYPCLPFAKKY